MTLIAEAPGMTQPTASGHLVVLTQAGFTSVQRHLKRSCGKRDEAAISSNLDWLKQGVSAGGLQLWAHNRHS
jgi:ArsR family transcriptional regulator